MGCRQAGSGCCWAAASSSKKWRLHNDLKIFSHVKLIEVTLYVSLIDSVVLLNGAHGLLWASLFSLRLCMVSTHLNSLILPDNSSSELKSKR